MTVTTIDELIKKYGYRGITILVEQAIRRAPAFEGDDALARMLGEAMADLESALRSTRKP